MSVYRINSPDVSAEAFDEEVLAINLKTGNYHSLRGAGVVFWRLLSAGCTVEQTADTVAKATGEQTDRILQDLLGFLELMKADNLLVPGADERASATSGEAAVPVGWVYCPPVAERHADMQELLLLDPIHEVGETGWPRQANCGPGNT